MASPSPTSRIWRVPVRGGYPESGTPTMYHITCKKTPQVMTFSRCAFSITRGCFLRSSAIQRIRVITDIRYSEVCFKHPPHDKSKQASDTLRAKLVSKGSAHIEECHSCKIHRPARPFYVDTHETEDSACFADVRFACLCDGACPRATCCCSTAVHDI